MYIPHVYYLSLFDYSFLRKVIESWVIVLGQSYSLIQWLVPHGSGQSLLQMWRHGETNPHSPAKEKTAAPYYKEHT